MENETNPITETGNAKKFIAAAGLGVIITITFVFVGLSLGSGSALQATSAVQATNNGGLAAGTGSVTGSVKEIALSISNGVYQPNPITVNKGDTVRLIADVNSIRGCYSTIVISKFGVRKTVKAGDNIIEFVASEAGTFRVTCGMGMAGGSIVVKDASGAVPLTTDVSAQKAQGSCGGSGGGCGCGG